MLRNEERFYPGTINSTCCVGNTPSKTSFLPKVYLLTIHKSTYRTQKFNLHFQLDETV